MNKKKIPASIVPVGVKEIALRSNVSLATVDRVLHNRTGVSDATRQKIQQIIKEECEAGRALSDAQISDRLLDYGIRIARRTVAKYRSQMHILPSTIR